MATVTYIRESKQSISAMKGVIDYCCQDKKVYDEISNQRLISGINCDGENAFKEFMATKKSYGKTDGMNFYQYIQSFSPDENITREQICKIIVEYCKYAGITLENKNAPIKFADQNKISSWAKNYVSICQRAGIVSGSKVGSKYYFNPKGNATRAEVATILMNFYNNYIA